MNQREKTNHEVSKDEVLQEEEDRTDEVPQEDDDLMDDDPTVVFDENGPNNLFRGVLFVKVNHVLPLHSQC